MTVKALLKEAEKMNVDDRTLLAHRIWNSVEKECEDTPLTEEVKAELSRRLESHKNNSAQALTAEEVILDLENLYPVKLTAGHKRVLSDRIKEVDLHPERAVTRAQARKMLRIKK